MSLSKTIAPTQGECPFCQRLGVWLPWLDSSTGWFCCQECAGAVMSAEACLRRTKGLRDPYIGEHAEK